MSLTCFPRGKHGGSSLLAAGGRRSRLLPVLAGLLVLLGLSAYAEGTPYEAGIAPVPAGEIDRLVFARLADIGAKMTDYETGSEVSRVSAQAGIAPVVVSP